MPWNDKSLYDPSGSFRGWCTLALQTAIGCAMICDLYQTCAQHGNHLLQAAADGRRDHPQQLVRLDFALHLVLRRARLLYVTAL